MNNQFITEKNEVLNKIKDIEDIENNNVKNFTKLSQLQSMYEKLSERIKKAQGKKSSKALISEQKEMEKIKKAIEVEKKDLLETKHQIILSDLNKILPSILGEDTRKMELQEISKKIMNIIKENHPDNNNGKNTEIDISWLEDVRKYLKKSDKRTNYNKSQNAASIENEEQLNSNLLSSEEIVDVFIKNINKQSFDDEIKKANESLKNFLLSKKVTNKNIAEELNKEFSSIIDKKVPKIQKKAVKDAIYSYAKALSNKEQMNSENHLDNLSEKEKNELANIDKLIGVNKKIEEEKNKKTLEIIPESDRPRTRGTFETDKEYEEYLQEFYEAKYAGRYRLNGPTVEPILGLPDKEKDRKSKNSISSTDDDERLRLTDKNRDREPSAPAPEPKTPTEDDDKKLPIPPNNQEEHFEEKNTPVPPVPPNQEEHFEEKKEFQTAVEIYASITDNIYDENGELKEFVGARKKDVRHVKYANIKVLDSFKNKLKNGNYIYNVMGVIPATLSIPLNTALKIYGKIGYGKKTRRRIEIMEERVNDLTNEQVEIILREQTAGQKIDLNFPNVVEVLMERRIKKYQQDKLQEVNTKIDNIASDLFDRKIQIDEIDKVLANESLSIEERSKLEEQRATLISGCKEMTTKIFTEKERASQLVSHGFIEDNKPKFTKMGLLGKRFANGEREIKNEKDVEFNNKLAELDKNLRDPNRTDEEALNAFIDNEVFFAENSKQEKSLFGRRDTGNLKTDNRFFVKEQDYRDDPLVGDIIRSVAIASSIYGVVTGINAINETEKIRNAHNTEIQNINMKNQNTMDKVHKESQNILNQSQKFLDGAETTSLINSSGLGEFVHNLAERVERTKGVEFGSLDHQAHQIYTQQMKDFDNLIKQVGTNLSSGNLSRVQALQQFGTFNQDVINRISNMCNQYKSFMQTYANNTNNFGFSGSLDAINHLSNPQNIKEMFDGMGQALTSAEALGNLQAAMANPISKLPNNIGAQITAALSTAGLVYYTSQKVKNNYDKGKYGGKAQDKLQEYIATKKALSENKIKSEIEEIEEEERNHHGRGH